VLRTPPERRIISAQLPLGDVAQLRELAAREDRSLSAEVRRAVAEYVERSAVAGLVVSAKDGSCSEC
jgi:predicted transcriptional regulator